MRLRTRFGVLVWCFVFPCLSAAQVRLSEPFHRLSNGELEILTTGSETEARALLRTLAEARGYFQQIGLLSSHTSTGVKIFSFRTKEEYEQVVDAGSGSFGRYVHGRRGDFIVLQDLHPNHREAAIHELTHAVIRQAGLRLPIWLNEGLADVYSSMTYSHGEVSIGAPLPARAKPLETLRWLDMHFLLEVHDEQVIFERHEQVSLFYGQSWALTHMLMFAPKFASHFSDLVKLLNAGVPSPKALVQVYGEEADALAADLSRYVQGGQLRPVTSAGWPEPALPMTTWALSEFDSSLELANLLAAIPSTASKADALFADLRQQLGQSQEFQGRTEGRGLEVPATFE